jgi:hypothetical protein
MKSKIYIGIWDTLVNKFGEHVLAHIMGVEVRDLQEIARSRCEMPKESADLIFDLCVLHGIKPQLYVQPREKHHGVMIACHPMGWRAWSLETGWGKSSRYIGSAEDLKPASEAVLKEARQKGWEW